MRALRIHAYGGPEQLKVDEVPDPHAGPGEIRIKVSAASINPLDGKILRGLLAGGEALAEPTGSVSTPPGWWTRSARVCPG